MNPRFFAILTVAGQCGTLTQLSPLPLLTAPQQNHYRSPYHGDRGSLSQKRHLFMNLHWLTENPKHPERSDPRLTEDTTRNLLHQFQQSDITLPPNPSQTEPLTLSTNYVCQGQGQPPILLLHGFDSSILEFRRLIPYLAEKHQVWAIDLLGFGFTERSLSVPPSPDTIKTHLYYAWKTLLQEPVILVGVSMGGAAALDFTLTYPELVRQLVLIDSAGLAKPPLASRWMFPPLDRWATQFLANPQVRQQISRGAYYDKSFASEDAQACAALHLNCPYWSESLIAFTKSGGYGSFRGQLSQVKTPTLIIWGEQDQILGTKAARQFQQLMPQSQLVWLPACGHVPHLEKPQETAQAILDFGDRP